jgi:hypothetical protein
MANRFCNIDGSAWISSNYDQISAGFGLVQEELDEISGGVDLGNFSLSAHALEGELTEIIEFKPLAGDAFTNGYCILQIAAPDANSHEATLSLMLTSHIEFADISMMHYGEGTPNYDDGLSFNIQKRSTGLLLPFTFQWKDGTNVYPGLQMQKDGNNYFNTTNSMAWYAGYGTLSFAMSNIMYVLEGDTNGSFELLHNCFLNESSEYERMYTGAATMYQQSTGSHDFFVAVSDNPETAITWLHQLSVSAEAVAVFDILNINGGSRETTQEGGINIKQGQDPTTYSADQISIYATQGADCKLGLCMEQQVGVSALGASDAYLPVKINGTVYNILLHT